MTTLTHDAIEEFMELFQGRTDVFGTWEGGAKKELVNYATFGRHLYGEELIGIYPLLDNSTVRWGCSDIDIDDIDLGRNLQLALQLKNIPAFLEKTRKGYHVWVFASAPIPAPIMRRAFLSAHKAIKLPPREVNPKQEKAINIGNYVRLPYPGIMTEKPKERFMLDDNDQPIDFGTFLNEALENRVTEETLTEIAQLHNPPTRATINQFDINPSVEEALGYCNDYIRKVWEHGPFPGIDRSAALCMITHRMAEYGVPINKAFTVLVDADKRWGKYHLRPNCTEYLVKIIESIYGKENINETI